MNSKDLRKARQRQPAGGKKSRKIVLLVAFGVAAAALATPPFGFVVNQIKAMGSAMDNISQQVKIAAGSTDGGQPWQLQLQAQGATDFYVQQLVLAPGGYSGWHTHPGLLIGTVVSGGIDFYDANCEKHSIGSGQVFTENNRVHDIMNTGSVDAELRIAYLIKHNSARRIEADAPACATSLQGGVTTPSTGTVTVVVSGPGGTGTSFTTLSHLITLDASQTTTPSANPTFSWSSVPGYPMPAITSADTAKPSLQLSSVGKYQVTVTVTDSSGVTGNATISIDYL